MLSSDGTEHLKADVDNWTNLVKEILNSGMYLEITCDIGELEMDVSREGLSYKVCY